MLIVSALKGFRNGDDPAWKEIEGRLLAGCYIPSPMPPGRDSQGVQGETGIKWPFRRTPGVVWRGRERSVCQRALLFVYQTQAGITDAPPEPNP